MSNNLGCYPLMRKGRNVDIVIAIDSSADIQNANWIGYTSGYAKQRKIQGWPVSLGWPQTSSEEAVEQLERAQAQSADDAQQKLDQAKASDQERLDNQTPHERRTLLGPLTIWVGSKESRESDQEPPPHSGVQDEWELMHPEAGMCLLINSASRRVRFPSLNDLLLGIVVAYLPLIANSKIPNVDPDVSPYLSTWNFEVGLFFL
jgi:phospholipase A2